MKHTLIILSIIACCLLSSCEKENITKDKNFTADKAYFPLQQGIGAIYKITEIIIDAPSNVYDTSIYYLKEIVDIPFIDNEGDTAYRIERYKSPSENYVWTISDAWEAKLTKNTAEKVEENQRFIKMRFPIKKNSSWNGNLKNDLKAKDYEITEIAKKYNYSNHILDSCINIVHDSTLTQITKVYDCEIYAKSVGLVYKEVTDINSQEVIYGVPIDKRVYRGTFYYQELVEIIK